MPEIFLDVGRNQTNNNNDEVNRARGNSVGRGQTGNESASVSEIPDPEPFEPIIIISAIDMANSGLIGTAFTLQDMIDEIMVAMERLTNGQISISQEQQDRISEARMAKSIKSGEANVRAAKKGSGLGFLTKLGPGMSIGSGVLSIIVCVGIGLASSAFPPLLIIGIAGGAVSIFMGVDGIIASETGRGAIGHGLKAMGVGDEAAMWAELAIKIVIMLAMLGASAYVASNQIGTAIDTATQIGAGAEAINQINSSMEAATTIISAVGNMVNDLTQLASIGATTYQTVTNFQITMLEVKSKREQTEADMLAEIITQLTRLIEILIKLLRSLGERTTNSMESTVELAKSLRFSEMVV